MLVSHHLHSIRAKHAINFARALFIRVSRIFCAASLAALSLAATAATIHVPADQKTIQLGIDASATGDIVLVAPGTYFENIDFKGKAITVTSTTSTDPATIAAATAATIIDGGGNGTVVNFRNSEPRTAVLSAMTIQHGGDTGSGIFVQNSSPTILNNTITENECWDIQTSYAAPLIEGNEISATQRPQGGCGFGSGAGIYIGGNLNSESGPANSPVIRGNVIEKNVLSGLSDAGGNGGAGVAVWGGSPSSRTTSSATIPLPGEAEAPSMWRTARTSSYCKI